MKVATSLKNMVKCVRRGSVIICNGDDMRGYVAFSGTTVVVKKVTKRMYCRKE